MTNPIVEQTVESNRDYHADHSHVSHSMLEVFAESPRRYFGRFIDHSIPTPEPTPAMLLGSLTHTLVLEPELDTFDGEYLISRAKIRSGKVWEADKAEADERGVQAVTASMVDQARYMAMAVNNSPRATALLTATGPTEHVIRWTFAGIPCKLRADKLINDPRWQEVIGIVDLKTAADPTRDAFSRAAATYGYHRQAAWYIDGVENKIDKPAVFYWVVVGKEEPYDVCIYRASDSTVSSGRTQNRELLQRYDECLKTGEWLLPEQREITELELPRWAQ